MIPPEAYLDNYDWTNLRKKSRRFSSRANNSSLLTRIATTESVSLGAPMKN